jgi:enoyl-CoA hydratase/carnithine racemase
MIDVDLQRHGATAVATLVPTDGAAHLDLSGLEALVDAVERAGGEQGTSRVLIRSGAEDRRLLGLRLDDYDALAGPDAALALAVRGERALQRLKAVPARTMVWIEGSWLAEACELALACDVRVASGRGGLGLPQPGIGHVPAWGGIVRLVRRAGPSAALWILTLGSALRGERARRFGVLDAVAGELSLEEAAAVEPTQPRWPWLDRLAAALPPLRRMALGRRMAAGAAVSPAREHLPRLVELAVAWPEQEALEREGELFAETVTSPGARAHRDRLRSGGAERRDAEDEEEP